MKALGLLLVCCLVAMPVASQDKPLSEEVTNANRDYVDCVAAYVHQRTHWNASASELADAGRFVCNSYLMELGRALRTAGGLGYDDSVEMVNHAAELMRLKAIQIILEARNAPTARQ